LALLIAQEQIPEIIKTFDSLLELLKDKILVDKKKICNYIFDELF